MDVCVARNANDIVFCESINICNKRVGEVNRHTTIDEILKKYVNGKEVVESNLISLISIALYGDLSIKNLTEETIKLCKWFPLRLFMSITGGKISNKQLNTIIEKINSALIIKN